MRRAAEPKANSASGVGPGSGAAWRVLTATALSGLRIRVSFPDGTAGEVHLESFLQSSRISGTLFEALRDPTEFARVGVVSGVVTWPNGAELAPDAMYDAIRATGTWVVQA